MGLVFCKEIILGYTEYTLNPLQSVFSAWQVVQDLCSYM